MADCMTFPDDWRDFLRDYSFRDSEEVYTNGSELIPVFRVEQLIEHLTAAQEPRVLTLEELQDWNDAVWFDEVGEDEPFIALIYNYDITMARISFVDTTLYPKPTNHYMRLYNKWWRCWTAKPTDEQREAEPWLS